MVMVSSICRGESRWIRMEISVLRTGGMIVCRGLRRMASSWHPMDRAEKGMASSIAQAALISILMATFTSPTGAIKESRYSTQTATS